MGVRRAAGRHTPTQSMRRASPWWHHRIRAHLKFGFDPTTFVSKRGTRYMVGETELDAELTAAGFEIVFRQTRPDLEFAIGHDLVRVARRP